MSQRQLEPAPWAPHAAVVMARAIGLGPETAARLLADQRMENVWRTLATQPANESSLAQIDDRFKLKHWTEDGDALLSEERLKNLTADETVSAKAAARRIDAVSAAFVACVILEATVGRKAVTEAALDSMTAPIKRAAEQCRFWANLDPALTVQPDMARALSMTASYFDRHATLIESSHKDQPHYLPRSSRARNDDDIRAFVRNVALLTRAVFGHTLSGTLATVANVVMKPATDVDGETVTNWCSNLPAAVAPCQ
jgi:hypothetical protein